MISRRQFASLATSSLVALKARSMFGGWGASTSPFHWHEGQEFILEIPLGNPYYVWPRTLLSYSIVSDQKIDIASNSLLCIETGKLLPFQIAKADKQSGNAQLLFFSDLPAGSKRTYRIVRRTRIATTDAQNTLKITKENRRLTINTGPLQIRIPNTQSVDGEAPGPILEVSRGEKWTGASKFKIENHPIASILTEELESGPLRSLHRITYTTSTGFKYVATVECAVGIDFVRLYEDMEAIPVDASGTFDFAWSGCRFAYRQSPNHPYNFPSKVTSKYTDYPWEPIAPMHIDSQFGVVPGISSVGKLPFSLRLFEPWQDVAAASFANFWDDTSSDAAAIFIDHPEQWEDHEYAIWHASQRIAVDFVYCKSTLHFVWKIAKGARSSCISFYDHVKDVEAMQQLERDAMGEKGSGWHTGLFATSYALNLQNWYGTLNLNKVKDWQLLYPQIATLPEPLFKDVSFKSVAEYDQTISDSGFVTQLALSGVRQNHGFGPTSSRMLLESWVPGYQVFRAHLSQAQRQRIEAILLFLAYVHAGEDYMPMRRMLSGHPNFLSDVKSTPPGMSFLFPEHSAADTWADEWEAYLHLNTRYHTRPAVESWNARGGRWTENLGTYVWAFLRPALRVSFLLKSRDGYERFCTPPLVSLGEWLINALSAPFSGENDVVMKQITGDVSHNEGSRRHYWGIVHPSDGERRVHPPIGAHSERRKTPRMMWYMGTALRNYSPLTGEHLMWAAHPSDQDMEATVDEADPYAVMYAQPDNRGTNPHLCSAKYTGYGITLRAAVDTLQELSVHLIQIDDGPNYRWGNANEGACGMVYFFANGKGYSHNGTEDAGDRIDQDTDFGTNFGVWKNGTFRSIGQNVLSSPFYDLSFAQFMQIVPREGSRAYSWPEYVSRSILLAGDDYFILHDRVFNPQVAHRFSWFVRRGDEFPHISFLTVSGSHELGQFSSVETETTTGKWVDGMGDSIALITHKEGVHVEAASFGGRVSLRNGSDLIFAVAKPVAFQEGKNSFTGTSGIIRNCADGWEIALFHGNKIAAAGFSFETDDNNLGISAKISENGNAWGYYIALRDSKMQIEIPAHSRKLTFFIDGQKYGESEDDQCTVELPAGTHRWELSAGLPVPLAPQVERTESMDGGAIVHCIRVVAASSYVLEISDDDGKMWKPFSTATTPIFKISGLTNEKKYHVRLIARNVERESEPGAEYPLYVTRCPPSPPDGLHVELRSGETQLSWGEVLGVTEYRLYRKSKGEAVYRVVYSGNATTWKDADQAIMPPVVIAFNTMKQSASTFNKYYVTSVDHNGESRPSRTADTDPASWRNFNPTADERFRRTVERTRGELPNDGGGRYYPSF